MQLPQKKPDITTIRQEIFSLISRELDRANAKFPPMSSTWEFAGIFQEEYDELKDEIRAQESGEHVSTPMIREAVQCAAMIFKMLESLPWYHNKKEQHEPVTLIPLEGNTPPSMVDLLFLEPFSEKIGGTLHVGYYDQEADRFLAGDEEKHIAFVTHFIVIESTSAIVDELEKEM